MRASCVMFRIAYGCMV